MENLCVVYRDFLGEHVALEIKSNSEYKTSNYFFDYKKYWKLPKSFKELKAIAI